jgi:hypothetical protein
MYVGSHHFSPVMTYFGPQNMYALRPVGVSDLDAYMCYISRAREDVKPMIISTVGLGDGAGKWVGAGMRH